MGRKFKFGIHKYVLLSYIMLMVVWIILTQSIQPLDVAIGLIVSKVCLDLSKRYFFRKVIPFDKLRIRFLLKYAVVVFHAMWSDGIKAMHHITRLKVNVKIYRVTTNLKDDFLIFILANTITLVPGTITIYREENTLHVLTLFDFGDARSATKKIKQPFENLLMEVDK